MENCPSAPGILQKVKKILRRTDKYSLTDEVVCACYLYKFLEYGSSKAYERFKYIFCRLSDESKKKAIRYYIAYAKALKKANQKIKKWK